jgi:hypothetical protein
VQKHEDDPCTHLYENIWRRIFFFLNSVSVIACLVLVSFWLPPLEENRINISCVSLICHCLCLINLWWKLKTSGGKNPLIGKECFCGFCQKLSDDIAWYCNGRFDFGFGKFSVLIGLIWGDGGGDDDDDNNNNYYYYFRFCVLYLSNHTLDINFVGVF